MKTLQTTSLLLLCLLGSCSESEDRDTNKDDVAAKVVVHPIVAQLNQIVIPKVDIPNAAIEDAFDYVRQLSIMHDKETDPARKGISMIVRGPKREAGSELDGTLEPDAVPSEEITTISISAENVRYLDLVAEIARQAHLDAYLTSVGIMVIPEGQAPFPNAKADEGEIWKTLRRAQESKEGEQGASRNGP